jgi:hypothetical protein
VQREDERYEKGSILLTSNRDPSEWAELFGNPLLANAALDRLADKAIVLKITGKSYRLSRPAEPSPADLPPAEPPPPPISGKEDDMTPES